MRFDASWKGLYRAEHDRDGYGPHRPRARQYLPPIGDDWVGHIGLL